MKPEPEYMPVVTTILAVATAVFPILFGFLLWKLSQIFVTKSQFEEYKKQIDEKQSQLSIRLNGIDDKLLTLLQRTAGLHQRRD